MEKKLLDDGTVYAVVDISNLIHINAEYNRQVGDDIIKIFTSFLKEAFGKTSAEFIYNGNGSFVILAKDTDYITVEDIMRLFRLRLDEREEHKDVVIEYKIGIAEIFKENKTARKLLSEAIKSIRSIISCGSAALPKGVFIFAIAARVSTGPGETHTQRIPYFEPNCAIDFVRPYISPALEVG